MSMIGQKEPAWTAQAYVNGEAKTLRSSDFEGKWHVLYWYPLDFTFVPRGVRTNHAVSRAFGVLKEDDGVAFRATVIVDDKGIVRSMSVNDLSVGRSPGEILRTVQALQSGGLCGVDWRKGDEFVG